MEQKKIIKFVVIILCIFILAAIFEISLKALSRKVEEFSEDRKEEKKQEEIYNSESAQNERRIVEFTKIICEAVKDKDYNYLWSIIDTTYKKYKFNDDFEAFKTYVNDISYGDSYEVTKVNKTGKLYQATIGVTTGKSYTSKYITINSEDFNKLKFMFDEYITLKEMDEIAVSSDLSYNISFYYRTSGAIAYVVQIKNLSDKDINLEFSKTALVFSDATKLYGKNPEPLSLKANESKVVELYFGENNNGALYIQLELIKNGKNDINEIIFSSYIP